MFPPKKRDCVYEKLACMNLVLSVGLARQQLLRRPSLYTWCGDDFSSATLHPADAGLFLEICNKEFDTIWVNLKHISFNETKQHSARVMK